MNMLTKSETAIYREQEIALAQINDAARNRASKRFAAAFTALCDANQAEKDAIDAAYAAGVQSIVARIIANRA